jgi:putative endopeptidase
VSVRHYYLLVLTLSTACATANPGTDVSSTAERPANAAWGTFGVDFAGMDTTVKPGDDFWAYTNGQWARTVVIPADQGSASQVQRLNDVAARQVQSIMEEMRTRRASLRGDDARVADYWGAFMDTIAIEARGMTPLLDELAPVRNAASPADLARAMGMLVRHWVPRLGNGRIPRYLPAPFMVSISQHRLDPDRYYVFIGQGPLGLPNRDYYLRTDTATMRIQRRYRAHLATILESVGVPRQDAEARSALVYTLERRIAEGQWTPAQMREVDKIWNPLTPTQLAQRAPGFDWAAFLDGAGLGRRDTVVVGHPSAVIATAAIVRDTPLSVMQDWVTVLLAKDRAMVLPKAVAAEEFSMGGVISGATESPERSRAAVELTAIALTDAVSRPYVERHFPPATKAAVDTLVRNILTAMDRRLANVPWMAPETRARARAKLAAVTPLVGYPDQWRSYDGMEIRRDDAYGNFRRSARWAWEARLASIDQPYDRREWTMMPIIANAVASPRNNTITLAAANLQPPHFDPHADPAVNYGAIGYVIAHEISHLFDDEGSHYDEQGRLREWWTPEDRRRFNALTQKLVAQYDAYEPLPAQHVRGAQTLGENIADNAGLAVAYDAYRMSLAGKEPPVINGFTGDQRFFLGRAQVNRVALRPQELRRFLTVNLHSPPKYRAWAVRNHDAWYRTFGVKAGDAMWLTPGERISIW